MSISIRQSGGAKIVSLPKAVIESLGLEVGSELELTVKGGSIVLTPIKSLSLASLLADSPKACFSVIDEDRQWIDASIRGEEI